MENATPRFFLPGTSSDSDVEVERRYQELREKARTQETGLPENRRIFSVACRHAGRDCVIEVGKPSPEDGSEVVAIFDLGSRGGFVICTDSPVPDVLLGRHFYSVTEFA